MRCALMVPGIALIASSLQGCDSNDGHAASGKDGKYQRYTYKAWSEPIKNGTCSEGNTPLNIKIRSKTGTSDGVLTCTLQEGVKAYRFPAGIFEIDEQMLVPEHNSITGARNPNDASDPFKTPSWKQQTLFLATRGATDYLMNYCHAPDMVTTRVGFVLSSHVTVRNVSYQGIDTIRPNDNGALCGGGVFETKGCAENSCTISAVNNAGSDGFGSVQVTIENVRLNDYYFAEDEAKVGASVEGNYECTTENWTQQCCFCKPNGIRSSQVGIWVPQTRNAQGTRGITVSNVVSMSSQGDGINFHGYVRDALVQNTHVYNTGDDVYALWGADSNPENVTFKDSVAVNPGILRPNWYGNCVATYGLKSVVFENITCKAPTLKHPIPSPSDGSVTIATSMFVFYTSFGGTYPVGNTVRIKGWSFEDLEGNAYTLENGTFDTWAPGKMVWTKSSGIVAPYYLPNKQQQVDVIVEPGGKIATRSVAS